jgi:hypothetical protein
MAYAILKGIKLFEETKEGPIEDLVITFFAYAGDSRGANNAPVGQNWTSMGHDIISFYRDRRAVNRKCQMLIREGEEKLFVATYSKAVQIIGRQNDLMIRQFKFSDLLKGEDHG